MLGVNPGYLRGTENCKADNLVESIINKLEGISEEVCEYACKHREKYGDTDELIDKHCEECPMMKIIY